MAEVKWIKIVTDIFDDQKIRFIETMPQGDTIIVIWFKLLCMCGKSNQGGFLMMTDKIAYTDEMLASVFNRDIKLVKLSLETYENLDMIEIIDNKYYVSNWEKHQNIDKLAQIREGTRLRVAKHRDKQKELGCNVTVTPNVTQCNAIDKDKEEDIDKDKDIIIDTNVSMSVGTDSFVELHTKDYSNILDYWNKHSKLKAIKAVANKRKGHLNARFKEHGLKAIYKVIDNCSKSSFMRGNNKNGWQASFDWVFLPNNFIKVLEGNYLDKDANTKITDDIERRLSAIYEGGGLNG